MGPTGDEIVRRSPFSFCLRLSPRPVSWDQSHVRVLGSPTRFATCRSVAIWAGRISRQGQENGGANDPETRDPAHSHCTSEK